MADEVPTLDEVQKQIGATDEEITRTCSKKHLRQIAKKFNNFKELGEALELDDHQITGIDVDRNNTNLMKIQEVLKQWREKNAYKATYSVLALTCLDLQKNKVAEVVLKFSKGMAGLYLGGRGHWPPLADVSPSLEL